MEKMGLEGWIMLNEGGQASVQEQVHGSRQGNQGNHAEPPTPGEEILALMLQQWKVEAAGVEGSVDSHGALGRRFHGSQSARSSCGVIPFSDAPHPPSHPQIVSPVFRGVGDDPGHCVTAETGFVWDQSAPYFASPLSLKRRVPAVPVNVKVLYS